MEQRARTFEQQSEARGPLGAFVVVPYVAGKLRPETEAAVRAWGGHYTLHALDETNPYAYALAFQGWWNVSADLVVIEEDIVPADGMIYEMVTCPHDWCVRPYHIGNHRYTTGLGMCKISAKLRGAFPSAGHLAARDPRGGKRMMHYLGLNESVERQLGRYGIPQHLHYPIVSHLHYPETGDA